MWKKYRRTNQAEMRKVTQADIEDGLGLSSRISVSAADRDNGSPKMGDMIARNPLNHDDQWLVAKDYYEANFEVIPNRKQRD